jgi:rsbT co-antagonist protein RsbR
LGRVQLDLEQGTVVNYQNYWLEVAESRINDHFNIGDIMHIITVSTEVVDATMKDLLDNNLEDCYWFNERIYKLALEGSSKLVQAFIHIHERRIEHQQSQIRTLASPIIPVYSDILVMPLIGEVDTKRASQIMEDLLQEVVRFQAEVVLLDITGVAVVDSNVANYLIHIAKATQLLGAHFFLVGISPEIAQTVTHLGIDLNGIKTLSSLQTGLEAALALQGRAILPVA